MSTWNSVVGSQRASARLELSRMRPGRGIFDIRDDFVSFLREANDADLVTLPEEGLRFNPTSYYHNVVAWCLAHRTRESLSKKERAFRASAFVAWGILYMDGMEAHPRARQIKTILDLYEVWWRIRSNMLKQNERFRTFDLPNLTIFHAKELAHWANRRLGFGERIESTDYDPIKGDFTTR